MRKEAYLLLLAAFLTGCTMFVREPTVTVRKLNVTSLDAAGASLELVLTVSNTNPYDVSLLGYSYDLKMMAFPLAHGGAREEIRFPAATATDLRIPVKISYGDLLEIFKRRPDPDRVPYSLSAGLDLETPLGHLSVPVQRSGTYAVPEKYRPASILNKLTDYLKLN